jgi:hypothetical protein
MSSGPHRRYSILAGAVFAFAGLISFLLPAGFRAASPQQQGPAPEVGATTVAPKKTQPAPVPTPPP